MDQNKTVVIRGREIAIGIGAVALLSAVIAVIVLISGQPDQPPDAAVAPTDTSQPTAVIPAANTIVAQPPAGSPLAPTIAPTAATVEHIVQEGDSLISIATLYHVDLQ